jgi:hypothetical protein
VWLAPLSATQVAWVRSSARPTISVHHFHSQLFYSTTSTGRRNCADVTDQGPSAALQQHLQGGGDLRYKQGKGRITPLGSVQRLCYTTSRIMTRSEKSRQTSTLNLLLTIETSGTTTKQNRTEENK